MKSEALPVWLKSVGKVNGAFSLRNTWSSSIVQEKIDTINFPSDQKSESRFCGGQGCFNSSVTLSGVCDLCHHLYDSSQF